MKSITHILIHRRDAVLRGCVSLLPQWITPNILTALRLVLILPLVLCFYQRHFVWMLLLFLFAFFLDVLDGSLARFRNIITPLGKILDPVADKLLFVITFWLLTFGIIHDLLFVLLIAMDLTVACMAFWKPITHYCNLRFTFSSNVFGKLKTITEVIAIFVVFFIYSFPIPFIIAELLFGIALLFAILNIYQQLKDFLRENLQTKTPS